MLQSEIFEDAEPNVMATYDDWTNFVAQCNQIQQPVPIETACEMVGILPTFYTKVVDQSFESWRESTTTSLLHGISGLQLGKAPKQGAQIFPDLVWQTRFLIVARQISPIFRFDTIPVIKNGKPIMVKNERALGVRPSLILPINKIIRCLYLYWWLNHVNKVKLPKRIYRGIRAHDLYNHETFAPAVAAIWKSDKSHAMKRKEAIDILIRWICDKKLHQITDGQVLSFTASIPVAKYFSNGAGFLLAVDPKRVQIITSELHDARLQGKDYMSNMQEKEYIVRIPPNYDFQPEDIIINDKDYFVAAQNPLCVALFDHDDIEAIYKMNGISIEAWYRWKTNEQGILSFAVDGHFGESRRQCIQSYGFDPMPTTQNLDQITDFVVRKRRKAPWQF
jgi:hypothetical protein